MEAHKSETPCFLCQSLLLSTVHFIEKFTFRDHGTIMITSYYEKYYSVITITLRVHYDYKLLRNVLRRNYDTMRT